MALGRIARSMAPAERILELIEAEEGEADSPNARKAHFTNGGVEFHRVQFSYERHHPVLVDINVQVPDRELTAIVGPTGSGKTSLVSLIPRLYDPDRGTVLVAGKDIRKFTKESLRTQISMVPQEPFLVHDTIAANIAYGDKAASFGEIQEAAWMAGSHDFIRKMPGGYNARLGERGETLSGGQRRLIALARALIRNAPIVIMDEPLAGLDAESAAMVMDSLDAVRIGRTMIVVTHDLALAARADGVIVMADGQVVEQGSHQALMASGGLYKRLVDAQSTDVLAGPPAAVAAGSIGSFRG
jgi:ATP-binding cassette subfamily B protein